MLARSRRVESREQTRTAILDAATVEFVERDFRLTTIDDIAAAARVSKGAVYYHFTDKAGLFEAVFRRAQEQLLAYASARGAEKSDPWEQLQIAVGAYLDGAIAEPRHRVLLQRAPAALGVERCQAIDTDLGLPVLMQALKALGEAGQLAVEPSEMLARIVFSALCEAAMAAGAADDPRDAQRDAASALDAIISGLKR